MQRAPAWWCCVLHTHILGNIKGGNLRTKLLSIFHPHAVPMGSDFTFQTDVTTAASLARSLLTLLMNSPTFISQGRWSEGNLPCVRISAKVPKTMKLHRQPRAHLGGMMPLLWFLNSFQTLSKQKVSMRLERLAVTEGVTHWRQVFQAVSSSGAQALSSLPGPHSEGREPAWPAWGPGIYSHQFYISPITINI